MMTSDYINDVVLVGGAPGAESQGEHCDTLGPLSLGEHCDTLGPEGTESLAMALERSLATSSQHSPL